MDDQTTYTYEVKQDDKAYLRFQRAYARSQWPKYLLAYLLWGAYCALVAVLIYYWANFSAGVYIWKAAPYAAVGGFFMGAALLYGIIDNRMREGIKTHKGLAWTCEITPEVRRYVGKEGWSTQIPWRIMKVKFEHPDGWLIAFDNNEVLIYREPLRAAGLEDEFRRRIGMADDGPA